MEGSDSTNACLKSVLRLSVDKGQVSVYFELGLTVTNLVQLLNYSVAKYSLVNKHLLVISFTFGNVPLEYRSI